MENLNKWDPSAQQAFLQPAAHNKNPVRVAAILTASALVAKGSLLVPGNLAKVTNANDAENVNNGGRTGRVTDLLFSVQHCSDFHLLSILSVP